MAFLEKTLDALLGRSVRPIAQSQYLTGNEDSYNPAAFHMQWHITERCNLRCTHCYQASYCRPEMSSPQAQDVLRQFKATLADICAQKGMKVPAHITISGGEPLVRSDFYDILQTCKNHADDWSFSILTNGTLIDEQTAQRLKSYNPRYVQVSIDGDKTTHDAIRGTGNFDKAVRGIKHLVDAGIYTVISFTAHQQNYTEFPKVALIAREIGAHRVWSDRLIPSGSGKQLQDLMLTPEQTQEYFHMMKIEQLKQNADYFPQTQVAMHRALQFLCGGTDYICAAGRSLVTVDVDGDVYPCRRMPINVGNVFEKSLLEIYRTDPLFQRLRHEKSECSSCQLYKRCQGGLRCLSYAMTGNPFAKDPGCWI